MSLDVVVNRRKLLDTRNAITHKFSIAGHDGYITVGLFEDGTPGELFLTMSKAGSTINGLVDAFAISVSHCLQYGVPLEDLIAKFSNVRFEPSGVTRNPDIRFAASLIDYVFRWLNLKFGIGVAPHDVLLDDVTSPSIQESRIENTGPPCLHCGNITIRSGSCAVCPECGETTGCG